MSSLFEFFSGCMKSGSMSKCLPPMEASIFNLQADGSVAFFRGKLQGDGILRGGRSSPAGHAFCLATPKAASAVRGGSGCQSNVEIMSGNEQVRRHDGVLEDKPPSASTRGTEQGASVCHVLELCLCVPASPLGLKPSVRDFPSR